MPTDRRRHAITETEDISNALGLASREWPELADQPGALLRRLVLVGRDTLAHNHIEQNNNRRRAITDTSGALTDVFGSDLLEDLREDWPE
ncbi:hypothetical protein [Mycolicibacterium sp. F2034L]|uniref:hypothetical protein n=1 Tax=Mycolicibacterium sp. F2034L TaxID=2926422 RepID=UPI001FF6F967|nr:hypothetical protein [Mycolicibacterium sp. F2034L]MCK0175877.1 hypothetical protein [Mycolicibacterium sp. F2034L]